METKHIYILFDLPVIERPQTKDHKTIFVSKEFSLSVCRAGQHSYEANFLYMSLSQFIEPLHSLVQYLFI